MTEKYNIFFKVNLPDEPLRMKRFSAANTQTVSYIPPQYFSGTQLLNLYNVPIVTPASATIKQTKIAILF